MGNGILDLNIDQFAGRTFSFESFDDQLVVAQIKGNQTIPKDKVLFPMRLRAHSIVLVQQGVMNINLDYQSFQVKPNTVLEVTAEDIVENIELSPDFCGLHVMFVIDLMVDIVRNINPSVDIGRLKRMHPMRQLSKQQMTNLIQIVEKIRHYINQTNHTFRPQLIKNQLSTLLLEIDDDIITKYASEIENQKVTQDHLKFRFINLLIKNCLQERNVAFYANTLCVTPDHLSRTLKTFSGMTAKEWINKVVAVEAKFLLHKTNLNIQQVASKLNFADQASFAKFFKKQTGTTPSSYLANINK